jgi:hypothetical protein
MMSLKMDRIIRLNSNEYLFEQLVNREADRDMAETQQSSQAEFPRSTGINN